MTFDDLLAENRRLQETLAARDAALADAEARVTAVVESNEALARKLALFEARLFGRKNERHLDPDLPMLPWVVPVPKPPVVEPDCAPDRDADEVPESKPEPGKPRKRAPGVAKGRRRVAEMNELPVNRLHCPLEVGTHCPACGGDVKPMPDDVAWRLEWVAGHFERIRVSREKRVCAACPDSGVLVAPEPTFALPRALCGNALLARVLVDKFADGLPLNRQAKRMAREGVAFSTTVLAEWVIAAAKLLHVVVEAIDQRLLAQKSLQGDDTGFPVQDGLDGHLRKGRLWCYTDQREVRFHFSDTKAGKHPATFLSKFRGESLLADLGSEFNQVVRERQLERGGCWAHLRRYFFDARLYHPQEARIALEVCRRLFAIEASLLGSPLDVVREVRDRDSRPLVESFFEWIRETSTTVRPKSALGDAIRYATNGQLQFKVFLERPEMPIHNNLSELQLRGPVVGRKAWLFARSEGGAQAAADLFTLVASCVMQGIDPFAYLTDVLVRLPDHPMKRVHELTPLAWRLARAPADA